LTEGIHYIKKAIELDPTNSDFLFIFGEVQHRLGFHEEAEAAYKKVLENDPDNADIWLNYSDLLFENDQKQNALEVLAEGIKYHPTNAELQYRMGACLMSLGNKQESISYLQHALQLDYDKHSELFEYSPQLKQNSAVLDLIESFKK